MPEFPLRLKYFTGDLFVTTLSCACIAWIVSLAVPSDWPRVPLMMVGMGLGMGLSILFWMAAVPLLGMLEPMIQIMLGGMAAGMAAAMAASGPAAGGVTTIAALGATCGACTALAVGAADFALRRRSSNE